jgi:cell wall-associated NlpC family hydrolase
VSIDTVTARITDIRSTIASLSVQPPSSAVATASPLAAQALLSSSSDDFASQLAALTGQSSSDAPASAGAKDGDDVVADAKRYLGIRYVWGGTDPSKGLDCSGLVQRVFDDLGVSLPRTVAQQKDSGTPVPSMKEAKPGDLLVFGSHHIGIYVGDGKMLHAPKTGDVVKIAPVYDTPTRIRRVLPPGGDASSRAALSADAVRPAALRGASAAAVTGSSFDAMFSAATTRYGLPNGLLKAVARAESGLDPNARSHAGAIGLMQLMPGTARELGVDPTKPAQAIDGAARLLRQHLKTFGSVPLALAAYNAGPGAVRKYDGIPPYSETRAYVKRVTELMQTQLVSGGSR